jgi:hypothetical protein
MIERLLERVALFARRRYRLIFVLTALLLAGSVLSSLRLRFDTEILNLLPQDDPVVRTFRQTLEEFGSLDLLLVVVRIPEGEVVEPYLTFADRLALGLEELDEIERVDYRIGELEELIDVFFPQAFLFLDEEGRRRVEEKLEEKGIRRRVQEIRRLIATPQGFALEPLLRLDPLGISEVFLDRLTSTRGALEVDWRHGYFLSRDRQLLLLLAKPVEPAQEVEFGRRLVTSVEGVVSAVEAQWPELVGEEGPPLPGVDLGGPYVTALQDATYVSRDILINAVTSMLGVLLLFLFAFRRVGLLLYAFVPLSSGLILAFGFASLTVGSLNAATSGFAALLVGLGIDFVIVSYGRYVEVRRAGRPLSGALHEMCGSSGRAVVTGGITTAATFYAFGVTEFTGLRQMGFLTGTGILFCMVCILVLLPAMLAWSEDHHERREREITFFLHGFGSSRLMAWCLRRPVPVLFLGAALTAVTGLAALDLDFVDSIRAMRPEGNPGVLVQEEVAERFGSSFDYMMLVISGETEAEVLELSARAAEGAEALVAAGELNGFDGVTAILPAPDRQQASLRWLERMRRGSLEPGRVPEVFSTAARQEGLRPEAFSRGLDLLVRAAAASAPMSFADLEARPQTAALLERYVHRDPDGGWKSVLNLYPPPLRWKREAPPGVETLAEDLGPQVVLTGVNLISERLRNQVRRDALVAAVLGFVLVAFLLWLDYRNTWDTLLSLAPLLVGIVWMLGGMVLAGLHMNFFNIFVTTMIIGIGVDYGVHIMHRFRELQGASAAERERGLEETGKAIVLAAVSTSVGFGSLSLSHYPGLRSMGIVAIMGAMATALVAITLLPAFLSLRSSARETAADRVAEE